MTWRRFLNRNGLAEGDYQRVPSTWPVAPWNIDAAPYFTPEEIRRGVLSLRGQVSCLLGDLRRLERDAVDERATAGHIARTTGVDVEVVAAVLKEFMAW